MWASDARDLVARISSGVVFVEVEAVDGKRGIGSAFHIGGAYFATARHVLETHRILSIGRFDTSLRTHETAGGRLAQTTTHPAFRVEKPEAIFYHPEAKIDAAIFKLPGQYEPTLQLDPSVGSLTEGEFLMQEVVVLGYPPIPFSTEAHIVVFRGEVSAVVEHQEGRERHFVISGMARGGFSGGPVVRVANPAVVLGVVSHSLVEGDKFTEMGFIGALSAKAIFETVDHYGLNIGAVQRTYQGFIESERPSSRRFME